MEINKLGTDVMSEKELKLYIEKMENYVKQQRKSMTKTAARESLIRTGILSKDGKSITSHQRVEVKK